MLSGALQPTCQSLLRLHFSSLSYSSSADRTFPGSPFHCKLVKVLEELQCVVEVLSFLAETRIEEFDLSVVRSLLLAVRSIREGLIRRLSSQPQRSLSFFLCIFLLSMSPAQLPQSFPFLVSEFSQHPPLYQKISLLQFHIVIFHCAGFSGSNQGNPISVLFASIRST